ncbi:MAG: conjugal transfer protein TraH [Rhodocyclaceae bacterium]|nr:conjugal transfer protein TraH [Rhodocyclaceae bacterium]
MLRKFGAIAMLTAAGMVPLNAMALSESALRDMLYATTSPSVYKSQNRMGAVGGAIGMRVPNQSINLMTFDPPRLDVGCGGIDMFGGSFSFINAEKLIAIFRNIGQIAAAALFKLAVSSISEKLGATMTEFRSIMDALNNVKLNSCKIGSALALNITDYGKNPENEAAYHARKEIEANAGKAGESWTQFWNMFLPDKNVIEKDTKNVKAGNHTWRAMAQNQTFKMVRGLKEHEAATLIMNIIGANVVRTKDNMDGECSTEDDGSNRCTENMITIQANTLTMDMLMDPEAAADGLNAGAMIMACMGGERVDDEFACQKFERKQLSNYFPGAKKLARKILFGSDNPSAEVEPTGGVTYYILNGSWGAFPDAVDYIGSIEMPLLQKLVMVQRDKQALLSHAQHFKEILTDDIGVHFAKALADAALATYSGIRNIEAPKDPTPGEAVNRFRKQIEKYQVSSKERIERNRAIEEFTAAVSGSLGSGTMLPPGASKR